MNKPLLALLMLCVCLGCRAPAAERPACPAIEITAVADAPNDSTRPVTLSDGKTLALARTPLVTSADITGAHPSLSGDEWVLNLDVTDAGAKRVQDFSKQHVGRTLALLAEGKVKSTPRIVDPITGKGVFIGQFDRAEAERLATAINDGCKSR